VNKEVAAIKAACTAIDPKYKPKLTWVVCGKRFVLYLLIFSAFLVEIAKLTLFPRACLSVATDTTSGSSELPTISIELQVRSFSSPSLPSFLYFFVSSS
jgi:hypothetical protein